MLSRAAFSPVRRSPTAVCRPLLTLTLTQVFRRPPASHVSHPVAARFPRPPRLPLALRLLSTETRQAIEKAVGSAPVVLFMKGTPETPQCGFSRASIQILGLQGVDPAKFTAFNVLEDDELRQGEWSAWRC
jgi:monothiol glutaredoxin